MMAAADLPGRRALDRQLGRVTMYRLVTIALVALVVVSMLYAGIGGLGEGLFTLGGQVISLAVLLVATVASSWGLARAWRVQPHLESSVITALLLYFLFLPQTDPAKLGWLVLAAILASASKFALAWRGRHVFNPTAAGAFGVYVVQSVLDVDPLNRVGASWWIASADLLPWVAVAALVVLYRTHRLILGIVFFVVAGVLVVLGLQSFGQSIGDAALTAVQTSPLIFLAGFMLSEPLTLPPRRHQQLVVAVVAAVVYAYPLAILAVVEDPPLFGVGDQWQVAALLVGNLVAFAFARRSGMRLELVERRERAAGVHELVFRSRRRHRFEPGQYAELHLPHAGTDGRGTRRMFSVSSPPGDGNTLTFALRVPEPASSFKRALLDLPVGATVQSTGVIGDFLLPRDASVPVVLVAGGIGVTPFLSQLRAVRERDAVLVYGVPSGDDVPFVDELEQARVVLVSATRPTSMPGSWTWVEGAGVTADIVRRAVPDLADRRAYVSGPPAMVTPVAAGLRGSCATIRTDAFTGY
ncbi:FAD-dependent oxidoreductase [Aeromicrobium sp. CF3.5]|uniref:FAD-dependent oxidoreductase n=1 Tax=Aeromicrobium sp. CF3.5 TaxID=3373078 RepID=UPI003EE7F07D